jgi:hypothetical protein
MPWGKNTMPHWFDIIPSSPFFTPAWRWELASWMVRKQQSVLGYASDSWVARATRHLANPKPSKWHDAIREAHALQADRMSPRTALLDALVLTGAPRKVIARRCDLRPAVVDAYEGLFFDVRNRLHHRDWISRRVIGRGLWTGFTRDDMGSLWRAFGFFGGIHILDVVVAVCVQDGLVTDIGALGQHIQRVTDFRLRRSANMAITASMLPWQSLGMKLNRLHTQIREFNAIPNIKSVASVMAESTMQALRSAAVDMNLSTVDKQASVA